MEHIKLPDKKDDIELLMEIANSQTDEVEMGELTEAKRFVYAKNIMQGETPIQASMIYKMYCEWKGKQAKKQPKNIFFRDFGLLFERKRNAQYRYYLLNSEPFDLSSESIWNVRKMIRDEKAKHRRKKQHEEKKQKQISGSEPQS